MNENLRDLATKLQRVTDDWTAEEVLRWAFGKFGSGIAISSAFGAEGMAVIDMASRVHPGFRLFTIDTDFLFPETYNLMDEVESRYQVKIEKVYSLLSPEEQERQYGSALWARNPDACCSLRKVEPLKRKLAGLQAWITGIRRDQTAHRASAHKVEWDSKFGLIKINPIVDWGSEQVWRYIQRHNVPYNSLHDRGYPSIGCTHCTRAIGSDEQARAGRWSGFSKTECGLHIIEPATPARDVKPSASGACD
jgi:phosphoadenosine phosphosulfate reductase